jgi:hypothetical protein
MTLPAKVLPPERWVASFILQRQQAHRTPAIRRMEQNYGREGIALMAAAMLSGLVGAAVGFIGIALLFLSGNHGSLLTAGYVLIFAGIALECPAVVRAIQGSTSAGAFAGIVHSRDAPERRRCGNTHSSRQFRMFDMAPAVTLFV